MTVSAPHRSHGKHTQLRLVLAALVVGVGMSGGFGHGVAWADPGNSGSSDRSSAASSSKSDSRSNAKTSAKRNTDQQKGLADNRTRPDGSTADTTTGPRSPSAGPHRGESTSAGSRPPGREDPRSPGAKTQRSERAAAEAAAGKIAPTPPDTDAPQPKPDDIGSPTHDTDDPTPAGTSDPAESTAAETSSNVEATESADVDTETAVAQQVPTPEPQDLALKPRRTPHTAESGATATTGSTETESTPDGATKVLARITTPTSANSVAIRPPDSTALATVSVRVDAITADVTAKSAAVTTTETTAPTPPEPLSPIAEIAALPGRIVNTVLQALGFTVAADGPRSPFDFAPIDQLLFAAFREVENILGLTKTPAVQPVPPTMTYTGPTDAVTPTVEQFLNAATAQYGLGTTPGGLQPFTVNGFQVASTNILSGHSGVAWVTPEQQIIISYQGTTGGTNLLFNPLITISQLIADMQVILTDTTPWAFHDALAFQQRVEAAAIARGYSPDDIFVTGHSLGGWEAAYVAQQTGLSGIGFESPGLNTTVPGNGADSGFVNIATYGDPAAYMSTDLPGLQPFMPAYVPGGGSKPHYGAIIMIGDPDAMVPLLNASALFGKSLLGTVIFAGDFLGRFFQHHLPGMQAYNLDVSPDPGVVPWLGAPMGPVNTGWGELTIPQLKLAAAQAGVLVLP